MSYFKHDKMYDGRCPVVNGTKVPINISCVDGELSASEWTNNLLKIEYESIYPSIFIYITRNELPNTCDEYRLAIILDILQSEDFKSVECLKISDTDNKIAALEEELAPHVSSGKIAIIYDDTGYFHDEAMFSDTDFEVYSISEDINENSYRNWQHFPDRTAVRYCGDMKKVPEDVKRKYRFNSWCQLGYALDRKITSICNEYPEIVRVAPLGGKICSEKLADGIIEEDWNMDYWREKPIDAYDDLDDFCRYLPSEELLSEYKVCFAINAAPHDMEKFEEHMRALRKYEAICSMWKRELDSIGVDIDISDEKTDDIVAKFEKLSELFGMQPKLKAYSRGVPIEDIYV